MAYSFLQKIIITHLFSSVFANVWVFSRQSFSFRTLIFASLLVFFSFSLFTIISEAVFKKSIFYAEDFVNRKSQLFAIFFISNCLIQALFLLEKFPRFEFISNNLAKNPLSPYFAWYLKILCFYHLIEFFFVLVFRPEQLQVDSFLVYHSFHYQIAFWLSILEFFAGAYFFPETKLKMVRKFFDVKVALCLFGLFIRALAFFQLGEHFNHNLPIDYHNHQLVSSGIYKFERHPSYLGFFIFALGAQILLANPICILLTTCSLLVFFTVRIIAEERILHKRYKTNFIAYKKATPSVFDYLTQSRGK